MRSILAVLLLSTGLGATPWNEQLVQANQLRDSGQAEQAEHIYRQILAGAAALAPQGLNALGAALYDQARYRDAELIWRKALSGWDRLETRLPIDHALIEGNLGVVLRTEDHYAEAETLLLDSLHQIESLTAPDSQQTGHAASSLAALYLVWGDLGKAGQYALRADAIFRKHPEEAIHDRRSNLRLLASMYVEQKQYAESKTVLEELAAGPEDRLTPGAYNDLAVAALEQNRLSEAESLAQHAVDAASRTLPAAHPDRAGALNTWAQVCRRERKYAEAEQHYHEAIAAWTASLGAGHPATAKGLFNLAGFYYERGREAAAEELYRRAAKIFQAAYGANHPMTLVARNELADVLRAEGRYTEAEKLSRSTLQALEQTLNSDDPRVARALANRVRLLESTRHPQQAATLRQQIEQIAHGLRQP
jgi:hypothetical protein